MGIRGTPDLTNRFIWRHAGALIGIVLLLVATLGAGVEPQQTDEASAGGSTERIAAGPYTLEALATEHGGEVHVRVRIRRSGSDDLAGDLAVLIIATDPNGVRSEWPATQDSADRYSADLTLAIQGVTALGVEIRGPDGSASVTIGSVERSSPRSTSGSIVFGFVVLGIVSAGVWLWRSSRKALRA